MLKIVILPLLILISGKIAAQQQRSFVVVNPSDSLTTEMRRLPSYDGINVSSGLNIQIDSTYRDSLQVTGPGNMVSLVDVLVKANTLFLRVKPGFIANGVSIKLPYKQMRSIEANGGSTITLHNVIKANRLLVTAHGGSVVTLVVDLTNVECEATDGGRLNLRGLAEHAEMNAKNAGEINAADLACKEGHLLLRHGSRIVCQFLKTVSVSTDQSSILMKGSPTVHFEKQPKHYQIQYFTGNPQ